MAVVLTGTAKPKRGRPSKLDQVKSGKRAIPKKKKGRVVDGHLYGLAQDKKDLIEAMMLRAIPSTRIAEMIQTRWKLLEDVPIASLKRTLQYYKTNVVEPKALAVASPDTDSKKRRVRLSNFDGKLDALQELVDLIDVQRGRVQKILAQENKMSSLLLSDVNREMRLMADLVKSASQLQLEMGITPRAPVQIEGEISLTSASDMGALFKIQERFSDEVRNAALAAAKVFDGQYEVLADERSPDT